VSLDINNLYKAIGDAITASDDGDELTAITRARDNNTRKKFPFATMDIVGIVDSGSNITNKFVKLIPITTEGIWTNGVWNDTEVWSNVDTFGGDFVSMLTYQVVKDVTFQISVRGDNDVSYRLAQKLHFAFNFEDILESIQTTSGATVATLSGITTTPDVLNTRLQEINSFNVTLRVIDEVMRDVGTVEQTNVEANAADSGGNPLNTP